MLKTAALAKESDVVVGAHPGLPDLLGFGRRTISITPEDAYAYVTYQVGALEAVLRASGSELHHVKPHGALYLMLNADEGLASAAVDAILDAMRSPMIYWPAPLEGSAFARNASSRGVRVVAEMYPDLEYASDGTLVLQRSKRPVDLAKAGAQVRRFVEEGRVEAQDGSLVPLEAESICVHGDGPNVVELLQAVRAVLEECGCALEPVASDADVRVGTST
jgi:5-oxoprolinase (ATP-hydrolysing) subunit A